MEISNFEKTKVGGVEARGNFRMKASAKAFRILSDGLYQNKIAAVIRELGTNAYDSHVAAKRPQVPFEVHVPSTIEMWFSVRDFGVGMAPEVLEELYVTYFDSTKTSSNDFTGCLGLGSKSPFSYSDNFTISSVWDGKKRIYLARLDSEGMPCIDLVSENETEEETGIEVRVNIKNAGEIANWQNQILEIYSHFETFPELINGGEVHDDLMARMKQIRHSYEADFIAEKDGIKIFSMGAADSSKYPALPLKQSKIVMGNVAYPFPRAAEFFNENASEIESQILSMATFYVKVPIGFLDIAASRESLSIDQNTKKNLQKITILIRDLLIEKIQSEIKGVKTVYEGICLFDKIKEKYPNVNLSNNKLFPLGFAVDGKDIQKHWYEPTKVNAFADQLTVDPKAYTTSFAMGFERNIGQKSEKEISDAFNDTLQKVKPHTVKTSRIPYSFIQTRLGESYSPYSYTYSAGFKKDVIIFIDGDKPLVYNRVIEEFLHDLAIEEASLKKKEIVEKIKTAKSGYTFDVTIEIHALVIRAYDFEGSKEGAGALKFVEKTHIDENRGVYFVSDFVEKYKKVRNSTPRAKKEPKEFWSLKTYKMIGKGSYGSKQDYYDSIELTEESADSEFLFVERKGLDWSIPGVSKTETYSNPGTNKLFSFIGSKMKNFTVLAPTPTQLAQLKKRDFTLIPLEETLLELVQTEIAALQQEDVKVFFDMVVESHSLKNWLAALDAVKNNKNKEVIEWLIKEYLTSKVSKTSLFDRQKSDRLTRLTDVFNEMDNKSGDFQVCNLSVRALNESVANAKNALQKTINGEDLVNKMLKEVPVLETFNYEIYRMQYNDNYYADKKNKFSKVLEYLQTLEAHKK